MADRTADPVVSVKNPYLGEVTLQGGPFDGEVISAGPCVAIHMPFYFPAEDSIEFDTAIYQPIAGRWVFVWTELERMSLD